MIEASNKSGTLQQYSPVNIQSTEHTLYNITEHPLQLIFGQQQHQDI